MVNQIEQLNVRQPVPDPIRLARMVNQIAWLSRQIFFIHVTSPLGSQESAAESEQKPIYAKTRNQPKAKQNEHATPDPVRQLDQEIPGRVFTLAVSNATAQPLVTRLALRVRCRWYR